MKVANCITRKMVRCSLLLKGRGYTRLAVVQWNPPSEDIHHHIRENMIDNTAVDRKCMVCFSIHCCRKIKHKKISLERWKFKQEGNPLYLQNIKELL